MGSSGNDDRPIKNPPDTRDGTSFPVPEVAAPGSLRRPVEPTVPFAATPSDGTAAAPTRPTTVTPTGIRGAVRRWRSWIVGGAAFLVALVVGGPRVLESLSVVSTDDAYVNGHVTLVAPRVAGTVTRVLVDDNNRVRKGQLLGQLDKEPYRVQVNIAQAAVVAARSDLVAAQAQTRGAEGQAQSLRFSLERASEAVDNRIALLR